MKPISAQKVKTLAEFLIQEARRSGRESPVFKQERAWGLNKADTQRVKDAYAQLKAGK